MKTSKNLVSILKHKIEKIEKSASLIGNVQDIIPELVDRLIIILNH